MSTRQDPKRNAERRLYALVFTLAWALYATLATGCAGINFRHMRVDGVTLPGAMYAEFRRVSGPELIAHFGANPHDRLIPPVVDVPRPYSRQRAYRQVRTLALWTIDHGYTCEIWTLRRKGWAAHPVLAVTLPGGVVMFDPAMHDMTTKLGRWEVVCTMDHDEITHKGILEIGRQLNPTKGHDDE